MEKRRSFCVMLNLLNLRINSNVNHDLQRDLNLTEITKNHLILTKFPNNVSRLIILFLVVFMDKQKNSTNLGLAQQDEMINNQV